MEWLKVAVAGGSGFVGNAIVRLLVEEGHQVYVLTRNKNKPTIKNSIPVEWLRENSRPERALEGVDAIINLAGTSLNSGRWTKKQKKRILQSRINANREIHRIIGQLKKRPLLLLNASAIGYYEPSLEQTYTEEWEQAGENFLAETVVRWEYEANQVREFDVRVVVARFGLILGPKGGAFPKLILPYKLFMGGKLGSGRQWYSWIHVEDVANALLFCMEHSEVCGPVNFTAPNPVRMEDFGKTIADVLKKPHWSIVPSPVIQAALGEMSMLILEGQKVMPQKLVNEGYSFIYPDLQSALKQLLND